MAITEPLWESLEPFFVPAQLCQAFFVLAAAAVLAVAATPSSARGLVTQYGARNSSAPSSSESGSQDDPERDKFTKLICWATSIGQVPHRWFIHFYILSVSGSIFWVVQYLCQGSVLQAIAQYQATKSSSSMSSKQVALVWFLMAMQGFRRLYECLFVIRPSSSEMWIVHWLLGCAYYLCIGVSVWIEGSSESSECPERNG
ncbi:hypothetical protein BJ170DRAFT_337183 [Xylariales sp. AK1849]|nr:hypothetical protein BJ170DRAFT_337183 [Xylariales sp. AK1849]